MFSHKTKKTACVAVGGFTKDEEACVEFSTLQDLVKPLLEIKIVTKYYRVSDVINGLISDLSGEDF